MKYEDARGLLGGDNPVLCSDGKMGMLLIHSTEQEMCGVQVQGEPLHRWIPKSDLMFTSEGAVRQVGSPLTPQGVEESMVQYLLYLDWIQRKGFNLIELEQGASHDQTSQA